MTNNNASEAKRPRNITSIVACSLISGLVSAIALVALPLAGARENVISGAVLIAFAFGWAMLALLSLGFTGQPQRWAAVPAAFFAVFGVGLLAWPGVVSQEWLNWIWPVILLALVLWMTKRVRLELRSRTSRSLLYPVFAVLSIAAVGGAYETVRERMDRATYSAPGQLVDVGGRRL